MMEDTNFFGVDIVEAYDLKIEELYKIISENTKYLDNITKEKIKDIKVTYYKEIVFLLKDGKVYLDGIEQYQNIKELVFMSGVNIFGITNENQIIAITGSDNNTRFMSSNN